MASILNNIQRRINSLFGVNRVVSSLSAFYIGTNEVYVHIDTEKAISEGYNGNAAVYAIVGKDARKFASIPVYLCRETEDGNERVDNELSKLLDRPNEYQGQDAFRELLRTYYKVTGEAFIWLNRGVLADDVEGKERLKMPVLEMYVMPSDCVIVVPDPNNIYGILGYKLDAGGRPIDIPKEDIIHWKNVSLDFDASSRSHLRGFSPLSAGYKSLQTDNSQTDAMVRMAQNDGAKGVLFNETLDKLTAAQRASIEGVVDRKINSNNVKGAVVTIQGKYGYLDLGKSNTDLGLLEGKAYSMKELCFLFDVPFELFDSETTFANKEQAQKGWVSNSIIPACKQFDDECNRVLLQAFGLTGVKIESDFDKLPEMQEDLKKKAETLLSIWPLTPNQMLEELGFEKNPNPVFDEPWVPSGYTPLSQAAINMDQMAADLAAQGLND